MTQRLLRTLRSNIPKAETIAELGRDRGQQMPHCTSGSSSQDSRKPLSRDDPLVQQKPKRDGASFLPLLQPTDRQCDALEEGQWSLWVDRLFQARAA